MVESLGTLSGDGTVTYDGTEQNILVMPITILLQRVMV
jgi:hypothetical protein